MGRIWEMYGIVKSNQLIGIVPTQKEAFIIARDIEKSETIRIVAKEVK